MRRALSFLGIASPMHLRTMKPRHVACLEGMAMAIEKQHGGTGGEGIPWPLKAGEVVKDNRPIPWPWSLATKEDLSRLLAELIGRQVRVSSGSVPQDVVPGRLTILTDANGRIKDLYVDPGLPTI